jgi:hypothetical protein
VDDSSPRSLDSGGQSFYRHGAVYSNAGYHTHLSIQPQSRIRGTLKLSNISSLLKDINISTPWIPHFIAEFNAPQLPRYPGTGGTIEAYILNRRELDVPVLGLGSHELAYDGMGEWTITVRLPDDGVSRFVEHLPEGTSPVPGSITGGGLYDAPAGSITWIFPNGAPPADMEYKIHAPAGDPPRPSGQWFPADRSAPVAGRR